MTNAMRIIAASKPMIARFCLDSFVRTFFQFIFLSFFLVLRRFR
jgi:hypothetical protein